MKKINEFKDGDRLKTLLLVSNCTKGVTNSGATYLNLVLQDDSGSIDGKLWKATEEIVKQVGTGKVYEFQIDVINYRGNLQAKVLRVESINQADIKIEEYVTSSPISKDVLKEKITSYISRIKNENISNIMNAVMNKYDSVFYDYPAATKNHHNFVSGLATHTLSMLEVADFLVSHYNTVLDYDLLISGVILHDIGKTEELSGPIMTEYTIAGKLLGHISMMNANLYQIAKEIGLDSCDELVLLRHLILSHHGKLEYGSPVLPMIAEAEALTFIDNLDSRMEVLSKAFATCEPDTFTPRLFPLENRAFFNHK